MRFIKRHAVKIFIIFNNVIFYRYFYTKFDNLDYIYNLIKMYTCFWQIFDANTRVIK